MNPITVVLGSCYGDEGKGAVVDREASNFDIVCRCQGGSNAGHTIVVNGKTHKLHLVPSGILHPNVICVIGNGVVVNLISLVKELSLLEESGVQWKNRLIISDKAHLVLPYHIVIDKSTGGRIGTTGQGIGPCLSDKANRIGVRIQDLIDHRNFINFYDDRIKSLSELSSQNEIEEILDSYKIIKDCVVDTVSYLHHAYAKGKKILVEGANALMIDIDFGSYPFVTSSSCSIGGVCTGLGIPPKFIGKVVGVMKSYLTRVGNGPMPTELTDSVGQTLQIKGCEFGTTTNRPRRCGWLDLPVMKYSCMINGYTELVITKLDVLSYLDEIKICRGYYEMSYIQNIITPIKYHNSLPSQIEPGSWLIPDYQIFSGWKGTDIKHIRNFSNLPLSAQNYINFIEDFLHTPISCIGVGPDREAIIYRNS